MTRTPREDDNFMRKLIITMIGIILAQGASFIYLVGSVVKQQDINTLNIEKLYGMKDTLVSIDTQMNIMVKLMDQLRNEISDVAKEQRATSDKLIEIMPTVDRAARHMDQFPKH